MLHLNVWGFQGIRKSPRMQWCKVPKCIRESRRKNPEKMTAVPAITNSANLVITPNLTPTWSLCLTSYSSYCFFFFFCDLIHLKYEFQKSFFHQNNFGFLQNSLGVSRYKIPILTCYLLPLSFGYALSMFYLIFNYFCVFLDFQ